MSAAPEQTAPALARAVPHAFPQPRPQARPQPSVQPPAGAARHALQEPTFDELLTGAGRHRGPQELEATASPLGRLALRARLLSTPARRSAARPAGVP